MTTKINLQDIPTNKPYEGYLWWSDKPEPEMYLNEIIALPHEGDNPFIIEGNLWCNTKEISYLIRFIDGKYWVYRYELKDIDPKKVTEHEYLPNRMSKVEKLLFKEVWEEKPDELCNNFEVLKPAFIAFVGFIYQEEKK
jgi:CRISPR type III-associated protein (TIGR04423 family)